MEEEGDTLKEIIEDVIEDVQCSVVECTICLITTTICQPFDVIRIRFQLQIEPYSKKHLAKYTGIRQAVHLIAKEDTVVGLWKGLHCSLILFGTSNVLQFNIYEALQKNILISSQHYFSLSFINGSVSGVIPTILMYPLEVVRTRIIAQDRLIYPSAWIALTSLLKRDGVTALYNGISASMLHSAIRTGTQFVIYETLKQRLPTTSYFGSQGGNQMNIAGSLAGGAIAGIVSRTVAHPIDLVRRRMQMEGFNSYHRCVQFSPMGIYYCLKTTLQKEQALGLYKGLVPSLMKAIIHGAITLTTTEFACDLIREKIRRLPSSDKT